MKGAGVAEEARRIEDDEERPAPLPRLTAVPPPTDARDTARALGLCVAEILTGAREVDSIARWITDEVHRHLQQRAALAARARQVGGRSRARPLLRVGSVFVCTPADGVAEATVVVHTRSHARAVAMRLEERQGRWRATAVGVL
ncbi:Rv3235 family protein [Curtobacterium sp. 22159]|uniref:Rv3235 family protein n=1 Tax=Curtobacterium sp. 22159 TaxID=3453882 RepID=UPI003F867A68